MHTRLQRLLAIGFIGLAYVHNTWIGWRKWGDLIIDCGKEWDIAAELVRGQRLYVDNRYYYGPLTPHVNALLFRCFGIHVDVLMYAGLCVTAAMCVVVYRLARCFMDRPYAALVTVSFLYLFAFSQVYPNGICNFVLPYSPAASYGLLLAMTSLYFLIKFSRKSRLQYLIFSSIFLALVGLTKMELFFATGLAHAAFFIGLIWMRDSRWRRHLLAMSAGLAAMCCVYAGIVASVSWDVFKDNVFGLFGTAYQQYSAELMGLTDVRQSALRMLSSFGIMAGVAAFVAFAAWLARRAPDSREVRLGLFAAGLLIGGMVYRYCPSNLAFNGLPVLLAAGLLTLVALAWKNSSRRAELLPHAVIHVFAFACLARISLNCVMYGFPQFFLLPPALLVFAALWFVYLPGFTRLGAGLKFASRGVGCGALLTLSAMQLSYSTNAFAQRTELIEFRRATMYVTTGSEQMPMGKIFRALNGWLCSLPKDARVLIVPYGVGFTFVADLKTPFRLHTYLPTDLTGHYVEENVVEEWKQHPPDYIVRIPTPGHAVLGGFGSNYALLMRDWILQNYASEATIGPSDFILIMKRR